MPTLWICPAGNHADRRLPVLLRVLQLQGVAAPQPRRLLRVLFLRLGEMPADSGAARVLRVAPSFHRHHRQLAFARAVCIVGLRNGLAYDFFRFLRRPERRQICAESGSRQQTDRTRRSTRRNGGPCRSKSRGRLSVLYFPFSETTPNSAVFPASAAGQPTRRRRGGSSCSTSGRTGDLFSLLVYLFIYLFVVL